MPEIRNDNRSVFDDVYRPASENYPFFELKTIDWDEIYENFRHFALNEMNEDQFFEISSQFIHQLRDGHSNIRNGSKVNWWLGFMDNAKPNLDKKLLFSRYIGADYIDFGNLKGKEMNNIGYIFIENFWYGDEESKLKHLLDSFIGTQGLIIDVRSNGGGSNYAVFTIPGYFTHKPFLAEQWIYKTGKGQNDFSKPTPVFIDPNCCEYYSKPVIILINRGVYSAANSFVNAMRYIPNVTLMGDTTGGGASVPRPYILANGWKLYIPDTFIVDAQGNTLEFGVAPDIFIEMNENNPNVDEILESALNILKQPSD